MSVAMAGPEQKDAPKKSQNEQNAGVATGSQHVGKTIKNLHPANEGGPCGGCSGGNCATCRGGSNNDSLDLSSIDLSALDAGAIIAESSGKNETLANPSKPVSYMADQNTALGLASEAFQLIDRANAFLMHQKLLFDTDEERRRNLRRSSYGIERAEKMMDWQIEEMQTARLLPFVNNTSIDETDDESVLYRRISGRSYYWAAEQRKKERAKLKELGNRLSADEKRRLEALEEELLKKQMQLEAFRIKNLENALSALDCPAAS